MMMVMMMMIVCGASLFLISAPTLSPFFILYLFHPIRYHRHQHL